VSGEADTLDHFLWTTPLSPAEAELRGDLQRVHDELRELLMSFGESRTMGARQVRVARIDEERVYQLYSTLKEVRDRHNLAHR
jgi:hypothetical protein